VEEKYSNRRFDIHSADDIDEEVLETIDYQYPASETDVEIIYPEFTSVCPWTGLPDFGVLTVKYVPSGKLVELKALKYYLNSFRNVGILQEHAVNKVLEDLTRLLEPRSITVTAEFNPRGGLKTVARAHYRQKKGD